MCIRDRCLILTSGIAQQLIPVEFGVAQRIEISNPAQTRLLEIEANAGDFIFIKAAATRLLDVSMRLTGNNEFRVEEKGRSGNEVTLLAVIPEDGKYRLAVNDDGADETGEIRIIAQRLNCPGNAIPFDCNAESYSGDITNQADILTYTTKVSANTRIVLRGSATGLLDVVIGFWHEGLDNIVSVSGRSGGEVILEHTFFTESQDVTFLFMDDGTDETGTINFAHIIESGTCSPYECASDMVEANTEKCDDGIDNDLDGLIDGLDPDCDTEPEIIPEKCDDGIDNDLDGLIDGLDPDCDTEQEDCESCMPMDAPTIAIGCVETRPGEIVKLPVFMSSCEVNNFSMNIEMLGTGAELIGLEPKLLADGLNLNSEVGKITYIANDGLGQNVSLNDTLFVLLIQLSEEADSLIEVRLVNTDLPISLACMEAGTPVLQDSNTIIIVNGKIKVISSHSVSGKVTMAPVGVQGIANVIVTLVATLNQSETLIFETITDENGNYKIDGIPRDANITISCNKEDGVLNGISTIDLVVVNKALLGLEPFTSFYQYIAADVDGLLGVIPHDQSLIRRLILAIDSTLPIGVWKFVPADFQPTDFTLNNIAYPTQKDVESINQDLTISFIGVKIGDVDFSANTSNFQLETTVRSQATPFLLKAHLPHNLTEEIIEIPFYVENKTGLMGLQFALTYEDNLQDIELILPESTPLKGLKMTNPETGVLLFNWYDSHSKGVILNTEQPLFVIKARTSQPILEGQNLFNLNQEMMIDEAIFDSTIGDITLDQVEFSKANKNSSNVYTLYQNRPNPTKGETTIDFDLPVAGNVIITLKNAIGQVEYTHI